MTSSVTIPDELRRKIKQLAAFYDTSQADILERAIMEFEERHQLTDDIHDPELKAILLKISKQIHTQDPERKKRFEKLSGPGIQITEVTPAIWGRSIDE